MSINIETPTVSPEAIIGTQHLQLIQMQNQVQALGNYCESLMLAWAFCEFCVNPLREAMLWRRARKMENLRVIPATSGAASGTEVLPAIETLS
jgi:hypothetical protein